jgi:hypothetical protein
LNRKAAFFIWYLVLWGTCTWALFEFFYDNGGYDIPNPLSIFLPLGFSGLLLAITGGQLFFLLRHKEIRKKGALLFLAVFLTATVLLVSYLAPFANASAANKATIQWYINDLKSQGFNVQYVPHYAYSRAMSPIHVVSYSNFTSLAKDINCSDVYVYGGAQPYFLFFVPRKIEFIAMKPPCIMLSVNNEPQHGFNKVI